MNVASPPTHGVVPEHQVDEGIRAWRDRVEVLEPGIHGEGDFAPAAVLAYDTNPVGRPEGAFGDVEFVVPHTA
eukprot:CAMPEP_0202828058 /NCGR_PEP_ID=MMETSP1389-20130828/14698_1 /ASSEMBLY_ACC=CAM_ASM_000865 /TAXON_ID=302021 /ORGANISM="Rhodomonas sp., Strain CCMP768" /LENGTH=72 /DNA_ID=CAMNT_0049501531 /DNA_START=41 /DNA_END=257 /DNA_ORIENTATION=-